MAIKTPPLAELATIAGAAEHVGKDPASLSRAIKAGRLRTWPTADGRLRLVWLRDAQTWARQAKQGRPKNNEEKSHHPA